MFTYKLRRDDEAQWFAISGDQTNSADTSISMPLCTTDFKSATPTASFTVRYNGNPKYRTVIDYILDAWKNLVKVHARIIQDGEVVASGYLDNSSLDIQSGAIPENVSLSIRDYITDLDKDIEGVNFVADKDDVEWSNGISVALAVEKVLRAAGYEGEVICEVSSTRKIAHFSITEDDGCTYREKIDKILFEAPGLVLWRNPSTGKYHIRNLQQQTSTDSRVINYLISKKLKTQHSICDEDGVKVIYPTVKTENRTVYTADINTGYSDEGIYQGEIISPGGYWPENGDIQTTYLEYEKDLLDRPYQEKTSRLQNSDLDLLYVRNADLSYRASASLDLPIIESIGLTKNPSFSPRKAMILLHNATDKDISLERLTITGDATYVSKLNKMTLPYDAKTPLEYETDYIFDELTAKQFATFYFNFMTIGSSIASWTEYDSESELGECVLVLHKGTEKAQGYIICQIDDSSLSGGVRCRRITAIAVTEYDEYTVRSETGIGSSGGKRIFEQFNEYYLSSSGESLMGGSWVDHYTTDPSKYLWTRLITVYSNGTEEYGDAYLISSPTAINTVTLALYKSTENKPSLPNELLEYNFETTDLEGDLQGWTRYIPTNKGKIWVTVATIRSRSNKSYINITDWSEVSLLAENGVDIMIQYCWSRFSDISPQEKQVIYNDVDVFFNDNEIWNDLYTNDHTLIAPSDYDTYLWMRTSGDNGNTWTYSMITGNEAKNFNLIVSPISYNLRRGSVIKPITVNAYIERYNVTGVATWSCDVSGFIPEPNRHSENISFVIPKGFSRESITIQVSVLGASYIKTFKISGLAFESSFKYLGKVNSIDNIPTETTEGPLIDNDFFLYTGNTEGLYSKNLIYIYDSSIAGFRALNSSDEKYSEIVSMCQADVWSIVPEDSVIATQWGYIKNLIVQRLNVVEDLFHAIINKDDGVDIKYNNQTIFKAAPSSGKLFFGKPNASSTEPESGFMYNPSTQSIETRDKTLIIDVDGSIRSESDKPFIIESDFDETNHTYWKNAISFEGKSYEYLDFSNASSTNATSVGAKLEQLFTDYASAIKKPIAAKIYKNDGFDNAEVLYIAAKEVNNNKITVATNNYNYTTQTYVTHYIMRYTFTAESTTWNVKGYTYYEFGIIDRDTLSKDGLREWYVNPIYKKNDGTWVIPIGPLGTNPHFKLFGIASGTTTYGDAYVTGDVRTAYGPLCGYNLTELAYCNANTSNSAVTMTAIISEGLNSYKALYINLTDGSKNSIILPSIVPVKILSSYTPSVTVGSATFERKSNTELYISNLSYAYIRVFGMN